MEGVLLVARALRFAAEHHIDQRRLGERGEPYVNHLAEVACLLAEATGGRDPALVAAGLLHDAVEDTVVSIAEVEREFGRDVAALVAEVTDDTALPKAERKRLQEEGAPAKSPRAKMMKLADKTSNVRSLYESPPTRWSPARVREYAEWSGRVVDGCRGASRELERAFDAAYARLMAALDAGG